MRIRQRIAVMSAAMAFLLPLQAAELQTAEVQLHSVASEQVFDAVIEAVNRATISAQTSGTVTNVYFDVDDYVDKDSVLVRFRDKQQRAALKAAEAKFQEAELEFRRSADLLKRKLIPQANFDRAEAAYKSARASLEQAQEQLSYTVVRAPYSGIVVERKVEPGESANPGQPLMTGLSLESLRAVANVSQQYIDTIRGIGKARVLLPTRDGQSLEADSLTISPYADPTTHTFKVRVELPAGRHGVYPGTFVKALFVTGERQTLAVPREAVVQRSEVSAVYVVADDGAIRFRQLRLGRELEDGSIEVLAGLETGERVALEPIRAGVKLKEQRAVR